MNLPQNNTNAKLDCPATLYLNDGSRFTGTSFGAEKEIDGEIGKLL